MTVTFLPLTAADKDAGVREEWVSTADLLQPSRGRKLMKELLHRKAFRSAWTCFSATSTQFVLSSAEVLTRFLPPDHRAALVSPR